MNNPPSEPLLLTRKDVLSVLPGRSERYVSDLYRNGLKMPTTRTAVCSFIQRHGPPSRIRNTSRRSRI